MPQNYQGNPVFTEQVCGNPILLGYYCAPIISLLGEQEVWLHIFFLPFSLIVIISMYILSRRFIGRGIFTALCLCITPVFVVMSQNIMLDIPLLAFFLGALATFIYGVDKDDKKLLFLSVILAGIASLIKYSGLLVILLMFIYALASSKKRYSLFLLISIFIFFLGCVHNLIFYNRIYFLVALLRRAKEFSINAIFIRIFACLSFLSGTSIISILLIPCLLRKKINQLLLAISLPVGLCPFLVKDPFIRYGNVEKGILALLFISSFFIIVIIFKACILSIFKKSRDNDSLFLSLWFIFLLIFTIGIQFVAARFILLLFPPMFLLIVKELNLSKISPSGGLRNKFIPASILITIIISTTLAIGDYRLAGVYRDFVSSLKEKLSLNKDIYFCP
ncbi:MAG: glycosyltransferase family 39 protein, partial [Chloroflexota bacterium]|nr:glycosyltransferase family 39 protein [Chloroflexota bacterium]